MPAVLANLLSKKLGLAGIALVLIYLVPENGDKMIAITKIISYVVVAAIYIIAQAASDSAKESKVAEVQNAKTNP